MKKMLQILGALAAAAAAVYVIAAYGDRITAWFRKLCPCCSHEVTLFDADADVDAFDAESFPPQEPDVDEAPVETAPVAEETDFEA